MMIEVILALTLIILFLSGVVVIEIYAIKNTTFARNKSISTQLANQQIERARVVRDSAGIDALDICLSGCYINNQLTVEPESPSGTYGQLLTIIQASVDDCPLPTGTPLAVSYRTDVVVNWSGGLTNITPAPAVEVSSCITDWRGYASNKTQ